MLCGNTERAELAFGVGFRGRPWLRLDRFGCDCGPACRSVCDRGVFGGVGFGNLPCETTVSFPCGFGGGGTTVLFTCVLDIVDVIHLIHNLCQAIWSKNLIARVPLGMLDVLVESDYGVCHLWRDEKM
jgi:hypothetical protein